MTPAPIPENENERLAALCRYDILDTPPEPGFDDITHLAAQLCAVPMALVSLVDGHRQWFKSRIGVAVAETPRALSFCGHAIHGPEILEIPDTHQDGRFDDHPAVTADPGIRFYAGAPLNTPDGYQVGTLCVVDYRPRRLTPTQRDALARLSRQVVAQMELHAANRRLVKEAADREGAQAALRLEQQRLSGVVEGTNVGTWEWNVETGATVFNERWAEIVGYTLAELAPVGIATWASLAHPGDLECSNRLLERHFAGELPYYDCECRMRHKAGHWVWVHDRGRVISRTPEGRPLMMYGTHTEITARKLAEDELLDRKAHLERLIAARTAELAASEQRFRAIFEQAAAGIAHVAKDGRFVRFNQQFCHITGYRPAELERLTFEAITDPQDLALDREQAAQLFSGEIDSYTMEKRYIRKDGGVVWVSLLASSVRAASGAVDYGVAVISDITESVRLRAALAESERFARAALDALASHIAVLDESGKIIAVNAAWKRFAEENGWRHETAGVGADYLAVCGRAAADADVLQALVLLREILAGERSEASFEYPCHSPAEERWFLCRATRFAEPGPVRVALSHQNITAMKRTQRRAEASQRQFRDLFEFAPDAMVMADRNGSVRLVNRQLEQLFGWTREELIGRSVEVLIPPALRSGHSELHEKFRRVARGDATAGEVRSVTGLRKDDSTFPMEVSLSPLESDEGTMVAAAMRNVADRIETEEALRLQNETLTAVAEAQAAYLERADWKTATYRLLHFAMEHTRSEYGFVGVLVDGPKLRVLAHDGIVWDAVKGRAFYEQAAQQYREQGYLEFTNFENLFGRALTSGQVVLTNAPSENRHSAGRPEGHPPMRSFLGVPITKSGQVIGVIALANRPDGYSAADTERVASIVQHAAALCDSYLYSLSEARLSSERQARAVAEQANAAKSAFLATVTHEIRTPLYGVIGGVDLLGQSPLDPEAAELVAAIRDSATSLLAVIDDILDFSKIEAGRLEFEREALSLEGVVESACHALKPLAARSGLELSLFIDPRLAEPILGDAVRLRQILNNLLSNAIKFSSGQPRHGRIAVRAELAGDALVRLSVADNGIGMSADVQAKLFKPFVQAEASTRRRYGGSGLGLSICQRLVELIGGRIDVESAPEQGSKFTVILPVERHAEPFPSATAPDLAGLRCLIVAHDPARAEDWCAYLAHAGAHAERFSDLDAVRPSLARRPAGQTVLVADHDRQDIVAWRSALGEPPALVVVEGGRRQAGRLLGTGVAVVDGEAMSRSTFLAAVAIASGRLAREPEKAQLPRLAGTPRPPDRTAAIAEGRLILVAEDNEVNGKLIAHQLALLGFAADLVCNGREALKAWRTGEHALLLTDLHMPEMDGYELTRAIRSAESGDGRLPIVAFSANVLGKEAEHCRNIGMDDYVTKPVMLETLRATLAKWLPPPGAAAPRRPPAALDKPVFDKSVLAGLVGDDESVIGEFLRDFRGHAETVRVEIRQAFASADWMAASSIAHRFKSSSRSIGALALADCCERIEQAGRTDGIGVPLYEKFETELCAVLAAIDNRTEINE